MLLRWSILDAKDESPLSSAQISEIPRGASAPRSLRSTARDARVLFKSNMGALVHLYAFLLQIFEYGNADIEKDPPLDKRLVPFLEFSRAHDAVDLFKVTLTHRGPRHTRHQPLNLGQSETPKLPPVDAVGNGGVQEKK